LGGRREKANSFLLPHDMRGNVTMADQIRYTILRSDPTTRESRRREPPTARIHDSASKLPKGVRQYSPPVLILFPYCRLVYHIRVAGATPHPGTSRLSLCCISVTGCGDLSGSTARSIGAASAVCFGMHASGSPPLRFRPRVRFFLASLLALSPLA
jgi:hypothetical protein